MLHLAAQSWAPDALRDSAATLQADLFGTLNLLQALEQCGFRGRMMVGTGDAYDSLTDMLRYWEDGEQEWPSRH